MGIQGNHFPDPREFNRLVRAVLGPEASYYRVILVYSAAISLLSLVIPISVQLLIDTIANIGRISAVVTIGLLMFLLLLLSGVLYAMRAWSMELFNRRLYARLAGEIALTGLMSEQGHFEKGREAALFNRYFDIMTLKKNIPYLLSHGFTLLFQTAIGFIVVSLYHFYFFVFCLVFLLLVHVTWIIFGWKAISSSFAVSESKHEAAAWLQGLAVNTGFFRARTRQAFAIDRTNTLIHNHIDAQQKHFRFSFLQLLSYLFIYALASAVLLGMGGWLVIQGQLTLGQLVAAELILSSIFYVLPQLAGYLDYYYDVCAAVEELARFREVPVEQSADGTTVEFMPAAELRLAAVTTRQQDLPLYLDFTLPPLSVTRVNVTDHRVQDALCRLLKRSLPVASGTLDWGTQDLLDSPMADVREFVSVFDRLTLLPLTLREYLTLAGPAASRHQLQEALALLELTDEIALMPDGLDTLLSHAVTPLGLEQVLRLKLACALLGATRLLVLTRLFDCLDAALLERYCAAFMATRKGSIMYFTKRNDCSAFTHHLQLGTTIQQVEVK